MSIAKTKARGVYRRIQRGIGRRARTTWAAAGRGVECCFCGWTGRHFLPSGARREPNRRCPRCGSVQRYRLLYLYLHDRTSFFTGPGRVLEIGPKRCFADLCRSLGADYVGAGLEPSAEATVRSDVTRSTFATDSFDWIVCFHVLEHIPDDAAAMAELWRVLKPGGCAVIQVPVRGDVTFEDPTADPADYERLFGQHDHVRWYGLDVADRLGAAGFEVEVDRPVTWIGEAGSRTHALAGDDQLVFSCRKPGRSEQ